MKLTEKERDLMHITSIVSQEGALVIKRLLAQKGILGWGVLIEKIEECARDIYQSFEAELEGKPGATPWDEIYETFGVADFYELCTLWVNKYLERLLDDALASTEGNSGSPQEA